MLEPTRFGGLQHSLIWLAGRQGTYAAGDTSSGIDFVLMRLENTQ